VFILPCGKPATSPIPPVGAPGAPAAIPPLGAPPDADLVGVDLIARTALNPVAKIVATFATLAITSKGEGRVDFCFNASVTPR